MPNLMMSALKPADLPPPAPPPPPQRLPAAREPRTPASACCHPPAQERVQGSKQFAFSQLP